MLDKHICGQTKNIKVKESRHKPYFNHSNELYIVMTEEESILYPCMECDDDFISKLRLLKHMQTKHYQEVLPF